MAAQSSSKYLQLSNATSSDIGKPSPLAMLAATCRKIGTSPRKSAHRRLRTRPPQPKTTPLPHTPVSTSSCAYLPPTPPPSPPMQNAVTQSASPALSMSQQPSDFTPLPLRSVSPVVTGHQPCYPLYQPVMRYSPYTTTPLSRPKSAPSSISFHPATTPYSPCTPVMVPVPTFDHISPCFNTLLHPHSSSSPPMFGVYPHHDQPVHATMSSLKVRPTMNRQSRRLDVNDKEEIIDVESL